MMTRNDSAIAMYGVIDQLIRTGFEEESTLLEPNGVVDALISAVYNMYESVGWDLGDLPDDLHSRALTLLKPKDF